MPITTISNFFRVGTILDLPWPHLRTEEPGERKEDASKPASLQKTLLAELYRDSSEGMLRTAEWDCPGCQ